MSTNAHLATGQIQAISSLSKKQVEQWIQAGVVVPSMTGTPEPGKGQRHRWSHHDAVLVAVVAHVHRVFQLPVPHLRALASWLRTRLNAKQEAEQRLVFTPTAHGVKVHAARANADAISLVLPLQTLLTAIHQQLADLIGDALPQQPSRRRSRGR